jgi:hypothetical protein
VAGSGAKTTLAARLQDVVAGSALVHTDDLAWWHSRFGWADLLIGGILAPARPGAPGATARPDGTNASARARSRYQLTARC